MVSLANLSFSARAMHRFLDGEEEEALRFWNAFLREEEEEEEEEEKEALKVRAEVVVVCIVVIVAFE